MAGLAPARLRPCRPLHQTPVVSYALAIPHPGLLPSGACTPSAFAAIPLRLSCCPRLSLFRGSITRPASSLPPASYAHCWAGTWSSLLTGWRGVRQVGLEPWGSHPLGNNNQFHRIAPTPKVSSLPWREHAVVRGFGGCAASHAEGTRPAHAFCALLAGRPWVVVTVPALVPCARW